MADQSDLKKRPLLQPEQQTAQMALIWQQVAGLTTSAGPHSLTHAQLYMNSDQLLWPEDYWQL